MDEDLEDHLPEHVLVLKFESDSGNIHHSSLHSPLLELKELRNEVLDNFDELKNNPSPNDLLDADGMPDEPMLPRDTSQRIVALFALSTALIENLTTRIFKEAIIAEEYADDDDLDELLERQSNLSFNLDLLRYTGTIDQGLYSDLEDVRQTRNNLVHKHEERLTVHKTRTMEQKIRKAVSALEEMYEVIEEVS